MEGSIYRYGGLGTKFTWQKARNGPKGLFYEGIWLVKFFTGVWQDDQAMT